MYQELLKSPTLDIFYQEYRDVSKLKQPHVGVVFYLKEIDDLKMSRRRYKDY